MSILLYRNEPFCANIINISEGGGFMNRIKQLRQERKLSIDQLSTELKKKGISISPASISKYEREVRNPKIENWDALANFFGVSVSYITGASDEPGKDNGRLKSIRNDKGLSLEQMANAYNKEADGIPTFGNNEKEKHISAQTIEDIENGKYQPSQHEWQLLAWALNVPEFYLSGRSNDKVGWQEWAEATGHPVEQIEKERQRLIDTKRLDKNLDIQYQIDYAIKSLEQNVPTTTYAAMNGVQSKLSDIRDYINKAFLLMPVSKSGDFKFINSKDIKVREDMDKDVYNKLIDIINNARWEIAKLHSKK